MLVVALVLPAIPAGRRPFWSQDEARFAVLARDMLEHHHWLVPEVRGRRYLNKPQLYAWAISVSSLPGGRVTEHTASLPSVLAAVATAAATVAIGRRLWGWPAGLLAGLILVATPAHFLFAHTVLPDPMLVAWLTWALWAYVSAAERGWPLGMTAAFYACVAGAVLTKGPVGLVALLAAALSVIVTDGARTLARTRPVLGVCILAASALPWIVPYYTRAHQAFSRGVVEDQYVRWVIRSPEGSGMHDVTSRLGHVASALTAFLPWTLLLAGAALCWPSAPDRRRRRLLAWMLVWWLATGLSGNFRDRYLLVVYPLFALLAAEFVATLLGGRRRAVATGAVVATALLVGLFPFILATVPDVLAGENRVFVPTMPWERGLLTVLALSGALLAVRAVASGRLSRATTILALTVCTILAVEGVTYPPRYARDYDIGPVIAVLRQGDRSEPVIGYPDLRLSYDFYIDRPVIEIPTAEALLARLADPAPAAVVTSAERWNSLASRAAPDWRVTATTVVGDRAIVVLTRPRRG